MGVRIRPRPVRRGGLALECLETRQMLSAINWTNRGDSSDQFASTFGADAAVARNVVDTAIDAWERVLTDFNQPGGGNTISVQISMETSGTGFGATASITSLAAGYPTAGSIKLGRGNDTTSDGIGDGAGYFLDPTPNDQSEFAGSILHAFTGNATPGGPAAGKPDLFTLVVHELTHVLGVMAIASLRLHNPLAGSVTDTGISDESEGSGVGRYFVFDGPSVTHLMTSNNGGAGGSDAGRIVHSAGPDNNDPGQPVTFESDFRGTRELVGAQDVVNSLYEFGRRYLPAEYIALIFQDAYGYEVTLPQTFGTFYAMINEGTGELLVRGRTGAVSSDDVFHLSRVGSNLRVSVDIGVDAPGSGPNGDASDIGAYVTEFPLASVSSIVVQGFDGNDSLTVDFAGGDPLPAGGLSYDGGFGTSNVLIVDLANSFDASHTGTPDGTMSFPVIDKDIVYSSVQSIVAVNGSFGEPASLLVAPGVIDEGQAVALDLTFDPGFGDHFVVIHWGDGQMDAIPLTEGTNQLAGVPHTYLDDAPSGTSQDDYTINVTVVDDELTTVFDDSAIVTVENVAPVLTSVSLDPSSVIEGAQATLQGTYSDVGVSDFHTLDVDVDGDGAFESTGHLVSGGDFALDFTFDGPAGMHPVNVRLRDDDGGEVVSSVPVTVIEPPSEVAGVHLFYNNSAFDGNGAAVDADDFDAIAPDKVPLTIGDTGSFANISGYNRGLNGLFLDVADLPADGDGIDAADFVFAVGNDDFPEQWSAAPAPTAVGVLPGAGAGGSDRIFVTFADGAVHDMWLRIGILANADTGLASPADYFFGSAPGETGANALSGGVSIDAADLQSLAQDITPAAEIGTEPITNANDLNHDGSVNAVDLQVIAQNIGFNLIGFISPQAGAAAAAIESSPQAMAAPQPDADAEVRRASATDAVFGLGAEDGGRRTGHDGRTATPKRAARDWAFASFDLAKMGGQRTRAGIELQLESKNGSSRIVL